MLPSCSPASGRLSFMGRRFEYIERGGTKLEMSADVVRYQDNLRDELNGAALYTALADAERDPVRKDLFLQLAQAEATHAQFWRDKLRAAGIKEEAFVPDFRTRLLGRLAKHFCPTFVLPTI